MSSLSTPVIVTWIDLDLSYSETPEEHKSHNCIVLPNGQIGLYPNNRCQWVDESLTPSELKRPDFLVSTRKFTVECGGPEGRLGDSEEYFWETPEEKDTFERMQKCRDTWNNYDWSITDDSWETPEEKDAFEHLEQMEVDKEIQDRRKAVIANGPFFAGNYKGPLYAPHPDLK
jgi:hypothetical protein